MHPCWGHNDTMLQCLSPVGCGRGVAVEVGGLRVASVSLYAPRIASVSPVRGAPGTLINIVGDGFGPRPVVRIGTILAPQVGGTADGSLVVAAPPWIGVGWRLVLEA